MAIKVIVELQAKPGRRDEVRHLVAELAADPAARAGGYLGSTFYEVPDNPDLLIDIADWESAEARLAHLQESMASGAYTPVMELLAAPVRTTVIRALA